MGFGQRDAQFFLGAFQAHVQQRPNDRAVTYLVDGECDACHLSYAELDRHARQIAFVLREHEAQGKPVALFCPASLDYVGMFLGCLYAGAIVIPVPPPDPANLPLSFAFLRSACEMVDARLVLCPGPIHAMVGGLAERAPEMTDVRWIPANFSEGSSNNIDSSGDLSPPHRPDDVVCLQLSSGATRPARAVQVTNAGLTSALAGLAKAWQCGPEVVSVNSERLSHHRGLFWGVLLPLFLGGRAVLLSSEHTARRPLRWLEAISRHGATVSGGTNRLYQLTLSDLRGEKIESLDLSTWRTAWIAGEPLDARMLDAFAKALGNRGFQAASFRAVYDLAEASSVVVASTDTRRITVAEHDLRTGHLAERVGAEAGRVLISVGAALAHNEVCCVASESLSECPAGQVGEIWCQGPTVAPGYRTATNEGDDDFSAYLADGRGPYLRTGDAGFTRQGQIYVLGRLAAQIVLDEDRYQAHEIERVVEESHIRTRIGGGAAFAPSVAGQHRLVVVKEVERRRLDRRQGKRVRSTEEIEGERRVEADRRLVDVVPSASASELGHKPDLEEVIKVIRAAVSGNMGAELHAVVLVKVGSLSRAPTGVVQRHVVRSRYEAGTLDIVEQWRESLLPLDQVGEASEGALAQAFLPCVCLQVAKALNQPHPEKLDTSAPLAQIGLTSIRAVVLDVAMAELLGTDLEGVIELPRAIAFQHPTIEALSAFLARQVHTATRGASATTQGASATPVEVSRPTGGEDEPIAIVGMGLRLPGDVSSQTALWTLLKNGADVVRDIPAERWDVQRYYDPDPDAVGKMCVRRGAFLDGIDAFDAPFFAISPQEARSMDPQQRLLTEVTWQALESAGQCPAQLHGRRAGAFVGLCYMDYAILADFARHPEEITTHTVTGSSPSIAAGRLCHLFGFKGPAIVVDTACSSGLVALHLAAQSLRNAECSLAIVGGVNLILSPHISVGLSRMHALAPDGYCKTFDATADGFARSEGCVVFVLKRLSDATEQADDILAVVRSSAINHDGRSTSLAAPNGASQQAVVRQAWEAARLGSEAVHYIEAHGTGTSLGDPVELESLGAALGPRDQSRRAAIGSVKTNIGHLEPAAGLAGLAKVVVALGNEQIPAHRRVQSINPHIALARLPLSITRGPTAWPRSDRPRTAGVSAFGFSGTNAHVVVQEAPDLSVSRPAVDRPVHVFCLSGNSPEALNDHLRKTSAYLQRYPQQDVRDTCFTANTARTHFERRLAVAGQSTEEICLRLDALGQELNRVAPSVHSQESRPKAALLFSGSIVPSWKGVGRTFYEQQETFRAAVERCRDALGGESGLRVEQAIVDGHIPADCSERAVALYATQVGLYELWSCWGLQPQAAVGFGAGEVAAARAAGMLGLEEGLELAWQRAHMALPDGGEALVAATGDERAIRAVLDARFAGKAAVAAVVAPDTTVIRVDAGATVALQERCSSHGIATKQLDSFQAARSVPRTSAMAAPDTSRQQTRLFPLVSGLTGQAIDADAIGEHYWAQQACGPIRLTGAIDTLRGQLGANVFLGIGLDEACVSLARRLAPEVLWVPSLRRGRSSWRAVCEALAQLYTAGLDMDWVSYDAAYARKKVFLPTHPFRKHRYWLPVSNPWRDSAPESAQQGPHPLLGQPITLANSDSNHVVCELLVSPERPVYLDDHRVHGNVVIPGTAHLEVALAAGWHGFGWHDCALEDVDVERALVFAPGQRRRMQVVLQRTEQGRSTFAIYSRPQATDVTSWECHVRGYLTQGPRPATERLDFNKVRARCSVSIDLRAFEERLARLGLGYGPTFRCVRELWLGEREAFGRIGLARDVGGDAKAHFIHPGLLDCGLQFWGAMAQTGQGTDPMVPVAVERYTCAQRGHRQLWCHMRVNSGDVSSDGLTVDLRLYDDDGLAVGHLSNLHYRRLPAASVRPQISTNVERLINHIEWRPTQLAEPVRTLEAAGKWLVLSDRAGVGHSLAAQLERAGGECLTVEAAERCDLACLQQSVHQALTSTPGELRAVIYLWSLDATAPEQITAETLGHDSLTELGGALALIHGLEQATDKPQVFFVTRGAQAIGAEEAPVEVAQALMWGFGRTVACELPELNCRLVDLDPDAPVGTQAERLFQQMLSSAPDSQLAIRNDRSYVPRLEHSTVKRSPATRVDVQIQPIGAYVIVGGLGAMGLETAKWLVQRGARTLVLTGRRGVTTETQRHLVSQFEDSGVRVLVRQADVSRAEDVRSMFAELETQAIDVKGIVHAAGVLDDGVVSKQSWERFAKVLAPKMAGAWNLHEATREMPLDFFISFSSVASIFGLEGQSNYATANAFLDALSHLRQQQGLASCSLNWGPVAEIGMAAAVDTRLGRRRWEAMGISLLDIEQLGGVLDYVLSAGASQLTVVDVDGNRLAASRGPWALVEPEIRSQPAQRGPTTFVDKLNKAQPWEQFDLLLEHVRAVAAEMLGMADPAQIGTETPFPEVGVDSLLAVDLRNQLRKNLDLRLPATLVFDYPTVASVAGLLATMLGLAGHPDRPTTEGEPEGDGGQLERDLQQISDQAAQAALDELLDGLVTDEA